MTRAFTLIETVVVIATTTLVLFALSNLIVSFYKTNAYTLEQTTAIGQARSGVEKTVRYLRQASYASDGSYPIANAATSSVTFYANINSSPVIERVTYSLIGGTLYQAVATPSGNPITYVGAPIATSTIATSVVNTAATPVFQYFDNTGAVLVPPVAIGKITSIKITVIADVNVNKAPVSFTLSGGATFRNLHNQL